MVRWLYSSTRTQRAVAASAASLLVVTVALGPTFAGATAPTAPKAAAAPAAAAPAAAAAPNAAAIDKQLSTFPAGVQRAVKDLLEIHTLRYGKKAAVAELKREWGLYSVKIIVEGAKGANWMHVTGDGKVALRNGFQLQKRLAVTKADRAFATCLRLAGLRIIGDSTKKTTAQQLQVVGGFVGTVFIDCAGSKENCKQWPAEKLPLILYRTDSYAGPRPRSFLTAITGCKDTAPSRKPAAGAPKNDNAKPTEGSHAP